MHVPKEVRSKLEYKSMPCIFVGYADEEFGYRLWNPNDGKVYRTWDVVFWEDESIEDFDESIRWKVISERVERVAGITFEHHTIGDAAILHE